MKIKTWIRPVSTFNLYCLVDGDLYNEKRDAEKEIDFVIFQDNGLVYIHTKGGK